MPPVCVLTPRVFFYRILVSFKKGIRKIDLVCGMCLTSSNIRWADHFYGGVE